MNPPSAAAASAAAADSLSFRGLAQLKAAAQANDPKAVMAVARQFEAMLLQQMLSVMDATSFGPDLMGENSGALYRSLFNQQIATTVSQGRGIGLASFLARELSGRYGLQAPKPPTPGTSASSAAPAPAAATTAAPRTLSAAVPSMGLTTTPETGHAAPANAGLAATNPNSGLAAPNPNSVLAAPLEQARRFAAAILPSIRNAATRLGVAPRALLAQAALETGWGRHMPGNNLFGIKAQTAAQGSFTALTQEFRHGVARAETAVFRAYDRVSASVHDYANLLLGDGRYRGVRGLGNDIRAFAQALQHAGYATDPLYASKLVAVANSPEMRAALAGNNSSFPQT